MQYLSRVHPPKIVELLLAEYDLLQRMKVLFVLG